MTTTPEHDARVANLTVASVYPHYFTRVEKKGRTKAKLHEVISWLTGFDYAKIKKLNDEKVTFEIIFKHANIRPNASQIKGVICGYRFEDIETTLTKQGRNLDKLINELPRGRKMEMILRK
jgi:hypothetical protein